MSLKALIAEADFLELELIGTVLARDGFTVERASDGAAAVERFEAMGGADLVVCTYALPGRSGAEVCAVIKKARPETRFVLLHPSGNDVDVCAVILSRVGCDAVLATPFRYDALKSLLVEWEMRPTKAPAAAVVPISFAVPPPDVSELLSAAADEAEASARDDAETESSADAEAEADAERSAAEAEVATRSDEPLPVVFPQVDAPVLAEFEGAETPDVPRQLPELAEYAPETASASGAGDEGGAGGALASTSVGDSPNALSASGESSEWAAASTEPAGSNEQIEATGPIETSGATESVGTAEPMELTASSEPTEPTAAIELTASTESTAAIEATASTELTGAVEPSWPTEPTEATEPAETTSAIDSTDAIEPTAAVEVTAATEPSASTEPTESTGPTEPTDATSSTGPTESIEAAAPTESNWPIEPTAPIEATAPSWPTEPTSSTDPTDPIDATAPTEPTSSTGPTEPIEAAAPTDPSWPTEPTSSTDPTDPIEATAPTDPLDATSPLVEPTDPFHSPNPPSSSVDWANELSGSFSLGLLDEHPSPTSPANDDALPPPPPMTLDGAAPESSGEAEWRQGPPSAPMDDEPTVNMREPQPGESTQESSAEQAMLAARAMEEAAAAVAQAAARTMDDEPTVIPGATSAQLPEPVAAIADDPFAGFGEEQPEAPVSTKWLATPPGEHVSDGFEAVDFGSIDSELDAAFGEIPTARVEAQDATSIGLQASEPALPVEAPRPPLPPVEDLPVELSAPEPTLSALAHEPAADAVPPPPPVESAEAEQPPAPPVDDDSPSRGVRPLIPPPVGERSSRPPISTSGAREWSASSQASAAVEAPRIEIAPALVPQPPPPPQQPPPPPTAAVSQVSPEKKAVSTRGASEWAPKPSAEAVAPATRIEAKGLVQTPLAPTENLVSVSPSPPSAGIAVAPTPASATPPPPPSGIAVAPPPVNPAPPPPAAPATPVFSSAPPPAPVGARSWRPAPSAPPPPSRSGPKTIDMTVKTDEAPGTPSAPPPAPREAFAEPPPPPLAASTQVKSTKSEPRTSLPPSLPPVGDLTTTPLPRLLFELYGATFCGALKLHRKGSDRVISIWNGIPVAMHVTPEPLGDDLASLLLEHGRITPEQHEDAERRAPKREAQLLVALGVIDERDLLDVIREQTELRLAASFAWRDGTYAITPSKEPPDSVVLSEVHPIKVIWRGVSEHYDAASLLQFFSTLRNRYIVATEVFRVHYETLGPFLRSANITQLLDGHTTFESALRSDDSKALLIAQCLYVLIVTEMIRAQAQPGSSASVPDAIAKPSSMKPVDYRELARACEEIAHMYLELKESDYFQMLELPRSASDRDVVAAHERIAKPYLPENLLAGLPEDVVRRAREIEEMLNRAHDTLISPEERRRYVQRLGEAQSAGANAQSPNTAL